MSNINVITSKCVRVARGDQQGWRVCERLSDIECSSLEEAMGLGKTRIGKGISVTIRPNYNESDSEGRFFREWRSFDGETFEEVRWRT